MHAAKKLIENALVAYEKGDNYHSFVNDEKNAEMCRTLNINPLDVWNTAGYVLSGFKPKWENKPMDKEERIAIVLAKHTPNDSRKFVFEVPNGKKLMAGDRILVKTKKGVADAVCCCNSFECDEIAAREMVPLFGGKFPLAPVVGKYSFEEWEK